MVVSVATAMIPFLENDDANRALMGANMQRQAVPLLKDRSARSSATGMEYKAAVDSGVVVLAKSDGVVDARDRATRSSFAVRQRRGRDLSSDQVPALQPGHLHQPCARSSIMGERVKTGDVLADGPATDNGEIALGKNALIGFMTWEGYNYEDAVLHQRDGWCATTCIPRSTLKNMRSESRDTKLGPEEITRDIPNVGEDALQATSTSAASSAWARRCRRATSWSAR